MNIVLEKSIFVIIIDELRYRNTSADQWPTQARLTTRFRRRQSDGVYIAST